MVQRGAAVVGVGEEMIHITDAWQYIKKMRDKSVDVIITDPEYDDKLNMVELRRICKGHIIAFCREGQPFFAPDDYMYWVKPPAPKNTSKSMSSTVEWIIIEKHGDTYNPYLFCSNYCKVFTDTLIEKPVHPYQKPVSLLERLVLIFSRPNDIIFDPFAGTGTTIQAALRHGRQAFGCDLEVWNEELAKRG